MHACKWRVYMCVYLERERARVWGGAGAGRRKHCVARNMRKARLRCHRYTHICSFNIIIVHMKKCFEKKVMDNV